MCELCDNLDRDYKIFLKYSLGGFMAFVGTATVVACHEFTS